MKLLPLVWSNLKRRKLRTTLTLLSVMMAFLLFGYLAAIRQAFNQGVSVEGADRLVVRHRVSLIQLLPESYKERIARIPGVAEVGHSTWFGGIYQDAKNTTFGQMPVEPEVFLRLYPEFLLPASQAEAWKSTRTGAIVGRRTADRLGWKVGQRIPLQATIWPQEGGKRTWEFDLVGIYDGKEKKTDTTGMFFRYDYFDEARAGGKGLVGWYVVRVKDPNNAVAVAEAIDAEFANSPAETKAETEGAFVQAFAEQIGDIGTILVAIMTAVFFTILLVAGNTMAQAVRERTEEIGVLKAMGFTSGRILRLVMMESLLLSALGAGVGLTISWFAIAGGDPTGGKLPMFYFPVDDLVVGVGLALVLGLATGVLPALQAMRLRIADALRRV